MIPDVKSVLSITKKLNLRSAKQICFPCSGRGTLAQNEKKRKEWLSASLTLESLHPKAHVHKVSTILSSVKTLTKNIQLPVPLKALTTRASEAWSTDSHYHTTISHRKYEK